MEKAEDRLKNLEAKFVSRKKQIDKIFGHPMFLDSKNMIVEGGLVARIRKIDDEEKLEFKEISRKTGGIEICSRLDNMDEGLKFLDKLNFKESFTVSKERTLYKYKGFSVCLDRVEHLGNFIEIEKLISKEEDKEKTKDECLELLQSLGLDYKIENRKYGDLMQEIINNKKG